MSPTVTLKALYVIDNAALRFLFGTGLKFFTNTMKKKRLFDCISSLKIIFSLLSIQVSEGTFKCLEMPSQAVR